MARRRVSRRRIALRRAMALAVLGLLVAAVVVAISGGRAAGSDAGPLTSDPCRVFATPSSVRATTSASQPIDLGVAYVSREGRVIEARSFGESGPCVLVLAGLHGDEPEGVRLAEELMRRLAALGDEALRGRVVVVPRVNPDGLAAGTRKNARGVDVNRNFATADFGRGEAGDPAGRYYAGPAPTSEPETCAILGLVARHQPIMIVTLHAPLACVNYDGPAGEQAAALAAAAGLTLEPDLGYATPGSLGTYFGDERDIPVITVELAPGENDWDRLTEALVALVAG